MRKSTFVQIVAGVALMSALHAVDAKADTIVAAPSRVGFNDIAIWPTSCTQNVASVSTTSTNGVGLTATGEAGNISSTIERNADSSGGCSNDGWFGNFAAGDNLVWTVTDPRSAGTGPLDINLSQGVSGIGAQIEDDFFGAFRATLSVYNGATLLGSTTVSGNGAFTADNSAVFLGVFDLSGANITRAVFSIPGDENFSINQVSLQDAVPEPASLMLLGTGLVGLVARRRVRKQ